MRSQSRRQRNTVNNLTSACIAQIRAPADILGALQFAGTVPGRTGQLPLPTPDSTLGGRAWGWPISWRPTTVLRAGSGIYYVSMREGANSDRGLQGFGGQVDFPSPDGLSPSFTLADGFPAVKRPPIIDPALYVFGTVPYMPRYAGRAPYFYDWNITVEQGIGSRHT